MESQKIIQFLDILNKPLRVIPDSWGGSIETVKSLAQCVDILRDVLLDLLRIAHCGCFVLKL